jgi:cell division cycle protein 20 (cofactor of APC complex)
MNNDLLPPNTPPRRLGRRAHLTPSKTPYVTPLKTPSQRNRAAHSLVKSCRSTGRFRQMESPFTPGRRANDKLDDGDRFIPSRRHMNMDLCRHALKPGDKRSREAESSSSPQSRSKSSSEETPLKKEFKRRMLSSLCNIPLEKLDENAQPTGIFAFRGGSNQTRSTSDSVLQVVADPFSLDLLRTMKLGGVEMDAVAQQTVANKVVRKVPSAPVRILDAPDIVDDYYLNLISWSKDNILAVALARSVYLWNATSGEIHHLVTVEEGSNYITSVNWCSMMGHTHYIAVGMNTAMIHLYDGRSLRKVRSLSGHTSRVSSLAWTQNMLTSGGRDSLILNHDIRSSRNVVSTYKAHTQEVCGLKWNEDGTCLASGGNENFLCLWDAAMSTQNHLRGQVGQHMNRESERGPRVLLKHHKAAVKALDWCPFHRGLLASGGGTADRTIKFWNTSSGAMLNSIDTGSQVCSIVWSPHQRELCSSHGYSENQLVLWKYPTMTKIKELTGHTARVLNMDMSPDGTSVVSAGADETLRFWNVFEESGHSASHRSNSMLVGENFLGGPTIR